ncbi:MAG TPA: transglutaminase family protein [Opitutaceae bacterium]|jgi:transglutaminase-like putative cysteine protease|nr:transglutaminase family protein [Opitutaceae bacterium]
MKLHVSHFTRYEYDRPVNLSPHLLYLRPRETPLLRVNDFAFTISPDAKLNWTRDSHDVLLAWVYFREPAALLSIGSEFGVETFDSNPFDFLLRPHASTMPFDYEAVERFNLSPYLALPFPETRALLNRWLKERFASPPKETIPYLLALNQAVFSALTYQRREEHGIQSSRTTLELGSGACRDYAVLLVELCRTLGLAARFVSGYLYSPPNDNHRTAGAMHAWVEVYLPGAGWKGLDPTHGVFCNDAFIPVAHAAVAESVNPIQGTLYSEQTVASRMQTEVWVKQLACPPLS